MLAISEVRLLSSSNEERIEVRSRRSASHRFERDNIGKEKSLTFILSLWQRGGKTIAAADANRGENLDRAGRKIAPLTMKSLEIRT